MEAEKPHCRTRRTHRKSIVRRWLRNATPVPPSLSDDNGRYAWMHVRIYAQPGVVRGTMRKATPFCQTGPRRSRSPFTIVSRGIVQPTDSLSRFFIAFNFNSQVFKYRTSNLIFLKTEITKRDWKLRYLWLRFHVLCKALNDMEKLCEVLRVIST